MLRRNARVNRNLPYLFLQLLIRHAFQLCPLNGKVALLQNPDFFRNRRSRYLMVTRNHHRADTCAAAVGNRYGGFLTRRVHHGNQTHKGQVIFIL